MDMSKNNITTKKDITTKKEVDYNVLIKKAVLYLAGVLTGMIVMLIIQSATQKDTSVTNNNADNLISTYKMNSEILQGDKLSDACDNIIDLLTSLKHDNTYIQLQVGDDVFDTYIYNKKGECFAQSDSSGYSSVALSDGRTVKISTHDEEVIIESDTDVLSLMLKVAELAKTDETFTLYDMVVEDEGIKEYRIDVVGEENIRKIYSSFGDQVADNIMQNLKASLGDSWEPHLIYCYLLADNKCTLYTYVVANNEEYVNFYSQGHVTLGDWELSEDYYQADLDTLDYKTACDLLENTVYDLEQILQTFAIENGLIVDEPMESTNANESEANENKTSNNETDENNETLNIQESTSDLIELPEDNITTN